MDSISYTLGYILGYSYGIVEWVLGLPKIPVKDDFEKIEKEIVELEKIVIQK